MKRFLCIGLTIIFSMCLSGCKQEKIHIVKDDNPDKGGIKLELDGHKGEMVYELEDAFWTENLGACGMDEQKIDPYSFVMINKGGELKEVSYPEYFVNKSKGKLIDNCKMYVCKIKVTNVNAQYKVKDMYENPYVFRADNLYLNYIDEKSKEICYKTVDYYSLRKKGDHTWSTYELHPGESITYELGFLLGNMIEDVKITGDDEQIYLGNTTGSQDGKYYQIEWSEK